MTGHRRRVAPVLVVFLCLCGGVFVGGAAAGGGSAASEPTAERTLNTTTPDPGETVRVTATVTRNSSGSVDYVDEFDPAFAGEASLVSLTVNGDSAPDSLLAEFDDTLIVSVEGAPAGTVTVTYDVTVPASATQGESYDFDGLAQTGEDDDDQTAVGGESTLVVGGDPPTFEVSLSSVPASVTVGETLTVEASVTNVGDIAGTQAVAFAVNGTGQGSTAVTLAPGASESVGFEYTTTGSDTPTIDLVVSSANATAGETVGVTAPASFEVSLSSVPVSVTVGETLIVEASVTNVGDIAGTQAVAFAVNGTGQETTTTALAPGETRSVTFEYTVTEADPPAISLTVSSANGTVTGTVTATAPALFAVSSLSVPAGVTVGAQLSGTATVTNLGGETSTQSVTVTVDGEQVTDTLLTLSPGENGSVGFEYGVEEADGPNLTVTVSSANETVTESVLVTERALFGVSLSSVPVSVTAGETLAVEAAVTNVGGETDTQVVAFAVDGEDQEQTAVTLDPGESELVGFEYTVAEGDSPELSVRVSSANETVTGRIAVVEPASFEVTFGSVPESVTVGEALTVPVVVTNAGGVSGTRTMTVTVDGDPVGATELSLAPGGDETVSFEYTVAETDSPELTVAASSASQTATRTVGVTSQVTFAVGTVSISDSVTVGETVAVTADVTNLDAEAGTRSVTLAVDGETVTNKKVTLVGDASKPVSFEYTVEEADGPTLDVAVTSGDDRTTATAAVVSPPQFEVGSPSVSTPATVGDPLAVTVTVANTGGAAATQPVTLTVDETTRAGRTVELAGGASETVSFEYTPTEPGNRALTAASDDSTATATVTVRPTPVFETSLESIDDSVAMGETVTVVFSVDNTGTVSATRTVRLRVAGDPVANRTLTLNGDEQKTVTFNHTPVVDSPATVEFSAGTATVTVSVIDSDNRTDGAGDDSRRNTDEDTQLDTGDEITNNSSDDSTGPGFSPGTVIICMLILSLVVSRQSRYR